jgi:hypothetical protein
MLGIVCIIKLIKETMTMASIPTQEEVLSATRKSQEAMMAAVKNWFETVRTATPKLTSVYTLTDKLPKLSDVGLPFADKLPTPQDAVASAYHLAEQLLASQRKFAEELLKVTAPLRPNYRENSPEVPSRSAWQEAVTHSEPKTPAASIPPKAPVASTPAKAPVVSTPPSTPVASTPARAPVVSTPPSTPVASTPAKAPAVSTPPKAPVASTPAKTPVASTPAKTPAASTPPKAPAASTPAKAAPARPAAKRTTATSAPKNAAAGSARKNAGTKTGAPKGTDAS